MFLLPGIDLLLNNISNIWYKSGINVSIIWYIFGVNVSTTWYRSGINVLLPGISLVLMILLPDKFVGLLYRVPGISLVPVIGSDVTSLITILLGINYNI